jgi:hypothetical protein
LKLLWQRCIYYVSDKSVQIRQPVGGCQKIYAQIHSQATNPSNKGCFCVFFNFHKVKIPLSAWIQTKSFRRRVKVKSAGRRGRAFDASGVEKLSNKLSCVEVYLAISHK